MKLKLSPMRGSVPLSVSVTGDTLSINGDVFDFASLPDGATLPLEAIESPWFSGPVQRIDGALQICLVLPHGETAPAETLYPQDMVITQDGAVSLPPYRSEEAQP